ncbi:BlaI/MecI/CopY family transcriptional regulator [Streptomyces sp. MI02-7b]|uniref:BlaI/MecI/CopY family transcriptional regulator n=1 Tax=Streptomyces sp. MI02-7b TaxID=462941 RepID=UPI0029BB4025|nr:BlaI/MecI/CopY family transcriptional regulator [Streptomyces sp. MI02-7b]MDX3075847.1 BlaI/MecI/CopY family transcriptional regulator [Streptomyces sp. MI02-7b]
MIHERLMDHQQPRTAAEVSADLSAALPDRTVGGPVVRSTLEQLVAKGRVSRSRQGRTVYYTAVGSAEPVEDSSAKTAE